VGTARRSPIRGEGSRTSTAWSKSLAVHTCAADQGRGRGGGNPSLIPYWKMENGKKRLLN
jgi:hypothetical protein